MIRIYRLYKLLLGNQSGATAIEYGLLAALLVLGIMASIRGALTASTTMWNGVSTQLQTATSNN